MHRDERSLKATLWSGCLSVFGLVLSSTTLLAAEGGDVDPPSAEVKTEDEAVTLPEMTVTATPGRETGYRVPNAAVTSKTDTPVFDSPFSLQVVPEQVMNYPAARPRGIKITSTVGVLLSAYLDS